MKLVDNLSEGGLYARGRRNSQGACGQTQEGDGRNLVADWQWEQSRLGVWVVYPSVVQIRIFSPVFV